MITICAYAGLTVATTAWYVFAANTGAAAPDPDTGRVYEITNRILVFSGGGGRFGGPGGAGYTVPVYVGLVSYCVCWTTFINWIVLVLAGIWRFLRQV